MPEQFYTDSLCSGLSNHFPLYLKFSFFHFTIPQCLVLSASPKLHHPTPEHLSPSASTLHSVSFYCLYRKHVISMYLQLFLLVPPDLYPSPNDTFSLKTQKPMKSRFMFHASLQSLFFGLAMLLSFIFNKSSPRVQTGPEMQCFLQSQDNPVFKLHQPIGTCRFFGSGKAKAIHQNIQLLSPQWVNKDKACIKNLIKLSLRNSLHKM